MTTFREHAEQIKDTIVRIRRQIHENPELGFQEFETAKLICKRLDELGIPYRSGIAKTGIVATLVGGKPGKRLMIRADMDALPMLEETGLPFASKNEGVFHGCGHDAHVSGLLGAAELLKARQEDIHGTIDFLFQPAEEGPGGAQPMIEDGAIGPVGNPHIDAALALHIVAGEEEMTQVGHIGVKAGAFTGSADELYITIKGKGGHASAPHSGVDPVYIASQVYIAIEGYITRAIDPMEPVVFTVGKIEGGFRNNIISETARMECTLRTLNEEVRGHLKENIPRVAKAIAQAFNGDAEVEIITGYPVGSNDEIMVKHIRKAMDELYDADKCITVPAQLGAEDFFYFGFKNKIPIAMFWLGGGTKEYTAGNHSNYFKYDEDALPMGAALLAATAFSYLNEES